MADGFRIGGAFLAALDGYVQDVSTAALEAGDAGIKAFHGQVQAEARKHPRWAGLADHIESWEEGGDRHVGVRDPRYVEAAMNAEFGDAEHPPAPFLRSTAVPRKAASDAMARHMGSVGMR